MGSFYGHIDEALFMLLLGMWWMCNIFPRYIASQIRREEYVCQFSFGITCRGKTIPIEAILKTVFPIIAIIGELAVEDGIKFLDEEGNFRKLVEMQHISIFGLFALHGLVDLLMSVGVPLPKGWDYLSGGLALLWFGISLSFHAHMKGKEVVEGILHILPCYMIYGAAISGFIELWRRNSFMAQCGRTFGLLLLGTWFTQMSFILFRYDKFPGAEHNPKWNLADMRNEHFVIALFGYHCGINLVGMVVMYLIVYFTYGLRLKRRGMFYQKPEECHMLLVDGSVDDKMDP